MPSTDGRVKLTKRYVDSATYEGDAKRNTEDIRWDSEVRGFGLRVYPSGKTKTFVIRYRKDGRRRTYTVGTYGVMTLEEARTEASSKLSAVRRDGADPSAEKKRASKEATMGELCDKYVAEHGLKKKTIKEDERRIESYIRPAWGTLKVRAIQQADAAALHHRIGTTRTEKKGKKRKGGQDGTPRRMQVGSGATYEANRVLALLSKIFALAKTWGILGENAPNPARGIQRYPERKRKRWLTEDELPALVKAVDAHPSIYVRAAIWVYLLTGTRKRELLQTRWEDIDAKRGVLVLPDSKGSPDEPDMVPLSPQVLSLLDDIPRQDGNPWVFPGRKKASHLVNIDEPWREIREAAGLPDVRLHDLRRTVGSWLATHGASLLLVGKVLRQSSVHAAAVYAHLTEDPARKALEDHSERFMGAVEKARKGVKKGS